MNEHPTIEHLSAHIDGLEPAWAGHVDGCARCRSATDALRSARKAVAVPPPGRDDAGREDAISRAIAAAHASDPGVRADTAGSGSTRLPVEALIPPRPAAFDLDAARQRRWRAVVAVGSVAAVLLSVLAAVTVLGGDDKRADSTASPALESESETFAGAPPRSGEVRLGGDLGEIADTAALAARVTGSARQAGPEAAGQGGTGGTSGKSVGPAEVEKDLQPSADSSASATSGPGSPPVAAQVGTRPCEIETRLLNQTLGPLLYFANARFQGTPSVVLGFSPVPAAPGQPPVVSPLSLFVASEGDCRPLATATTP